MVLGQAFKVFLTVGAAVPVGRFDRLPLAKSQGVWERSLSSSVALTDDLQPIPIGCPVVRARIRVCHSPLPSALGTIAWMSLSPLFAGYNTLFFMSIVPLFILGGFLFLVCVPIMSTAICNTVRVSFSVSLRSLPRISLDLFRIHLIPGLMAGLYCFTISQVSYAVVCRRIRWRFPTHKETVPFRLAPHYRSEPVVDGMYLFYQFTRM